MDDLRIRPADPLLDPVRDAEDLDREPVAQTGQMVPKKPADRAGFSQPAVAARFIGLNVPEDLRFLLLERARKGEDFAKLATENSDDPGSKDKGGEYDFFGRGKMVPEFDKAAFALKPGEISDIVQSKFGFHIIKLEELAKH